MPIGNRILAKQRTDYPLHVVVQEDDGAFLVWAGGFGFYQ